MPLDPDAARLRAAIYDALLREGRAPTLRELAARAALSASEARDALHRLADAHVIVLRPGTDELWMAMPFSAVPTAFRVTAGRADGTAGAWWANCAWDALGLAAMLDGAGLAPAAAPIHIATSCPDCDAPLALTVHASEPSPRDAVRPDGDGASPPDEPPVVHFAVPAAEWWRDIGFT